VAGGWWGGGRGVRVVIHAYVEVGPPGSLIQRHRFFNRVTYLIGGHFFSLNDIEHGILRGNRKPPGGLGRQFSRSDPRLPLCLPEPEPRIHFARTRPCSPPQ